MRTIDPKGDLMQRETANNLRVAATISKNVSDAISLDPESLTDAELENLQSELLKARRLVLNAISYREARYGSRR
jgi:hypothetical protein